MGEFRTRGIWFGDVGKARLGMGSRVQVSESGLNLMGVHPGRRTILGFIELVLNHMGLEIDCSCCSVLMVSVVQYRFKDIWFIAYRTRCRVIVRRNNNV